MDSSHWSRCDSSSSDSFVFEQNESIIIHHPGPFQDFCSFAKNVMSNSDFKGTPFDEIFRGNFSDKFRLRIFLIAVIESFFEKRSDRPRVFGGFPREVIHEAYHPGEGCFDTDLDIMMCNPELYEKQMTELLHYLRLLNFNFILTSEKTKYGGGVVSIEFLFEFDKNKFFVPVDFVTCVVDLVDFDINNLMFKRKSGGTALNVFMRLLKLQESNYRLEICPLFADCLKPRCTHQSIDEKRYIDEVIQAIYEKVANVEYFSGSLKILQKFQFPNSSSLDLFMTKVFLSRWPKLQKQGYTLVGDIKPLFTVEAQQDEEFCYICKNGSGYGKHLFVTAKCRCQSTFHPDCLLESLMREHDKTQLYNDFVCPICDTKSGIKMENTKKFATSCETFDAIIAQIKRASPKN